MTAPGGLSPTALEARLAEMEARLASLERIVSPAPPPPLPEWRADSTQAPRDPAEPRLCPKCSTVKALEFFSHPEFGWCKDCATGRPSGWVLERAKLDAARAAARLDELKAR